MTLCGGGQLGCPFFSVEGVGFVLGFKRETEFSVDGDIKVVPDGVCVRTVENLVVDCEGLVLPTVGAEGVTWLVWGELSPGVDRVQCAE